jgi:hypothetical protein
MSAAPADKGTVKQTVVPASLLQQTQYAQRHTGLSAWRREMLRTFDWTLPLRWW